LIQFECGFVRHHQLRNQHSLNHIFCAIGGAEHMHLMRAGEVANLVVGGDLVAATGDYSADPGPEYPIRSMESRTCANKINKTDEVLSAVAN
jgi:hypothetical protein